jgi:serine/threonine protein kinase
MEGRTINGYRLIEPCASFSMGLLYRAETESSPVKRCLVLLLEKKFFISERVARQYREWAQSLSSIRHPNILTPVSYQEGGEFHSLVFEDSATETLATHLETTQDFTKERAGILTAKLAAALSHAQERGVAHLHVNPDHVLVDRQSGEVKLTCFYFNINRWSGLLADLPVEELTAEVMAASSETEFSDIEGLSLLNYVSPEILEGDKPDWRSDMYSLGVLLFRMLSGRNPHAGFGSYAEYLSSMEADPIQSQLNGLEGLTDQDRWVISKATASSPAKRFGSYGDFMDSLVESYADPEPSENGNGTSDETILSTRRPDMGDTAMEVPGGAIRRGSRGKVLGLFFAGSLLLASAVLYSPIREYLRWKDAEILYSYIPSLRMRTDTTTFSDNNILPVSLKEGDGVYIVREKSLEPWAHGKVGDFKGMVNTEYLMSESDYKILFSIIDNPMKESQLKAARYRKSIMQHVIRKVDSGGSIDFEKLKKIKLHHLAFGSSDYVKTGSNSMNDRDYMWVMLYEDETKDLEVFIAVYENGRQLDSKSINIEMDEEMGEFDLEYQVAKYLSDFGL